jgi:hypothetical protein
MITHLEYLYLSKIISDLIYRENAFRTVTRVLNSNKTAIEFIELKTILNMN